MRKIIIILLFLSISSIDIYGFQFFQEYKDYKQDIKMFKEYNPVQPIWIPLLETLSFNILLSSYNRYIDDKPFAQISFDSVKKNFETGWGWDADSFKINMFLHPYQGSIYYNTARGNGYGYFGSMLVTAFGSIQWEYFMEIEPPSINDLMMTTIAGSLFGEILYRMSHLVLDDSTCDSKRFAREVWVMGNNPAYFLNRLMYGKTTRIIPYPIYKKTPFLFDLSLGVNNIADGIYFENGKHFGIGKVNFYYGNPFEKKVLKPLDFFSAYVERQGYVDLTNMRFHSVLYGVNFSDEDENLLLGIFQSYDYANSEIYQTGGIGIGGGITYRYKSFSHIFMMLLSLSYIPIGASNSDYAVDYKVGELEDTKNYNMGFGASFNLEINYLYANFIMLSLHYNNWYIHTLTGAPGDEFVQFLSPSFKIFLYKNFYLSIQDLIYWRNGYYKKYKDVDLVNMEQRVTAGFLF